LLDPEKPFHEHTISFDDSWKNDEVVQTINHALELKRLINQKSGEMNTWQLAVNIKCPSEKHLNLLRKLQPTRGTPVANSELTELLQVGNVTLNISNSPKSSDSYGLFWVPLRDELCPRCRRFCIRNVEKVCARCLTVLKQKGRDLS